MASGNLVGQRVCIRLGNIWSTLQGVNQTEVVDAGIHKFLWDNLAQEDPSARHTYLYQAGRWDGMTRLYDITNARFRSGLVNTVKALLEMAGMVVNVLDKRSRLGKAADVQFTTEVTPFPFQTAVRQAVDQNDMGIVVSKTGTGKSLMAGLIIAEVRAPTVILVTDLVLMEQMRSNLERYLQTEIGMIGDSIFDLKDITVSTYQSLITILNPKKKSANIKSLQAHMGNTVCVVSDEAHLFDSESTAKIMPYFENAHRFYGLSATPYGISDDGELESNLVLEQHFGKIIHDTRPVDMTQLRVPLVVQTMDLVPLNRTYIKHKKKSRGKDVLDHSKNYKEAVDTEIVNNPDYHKFIAEKAMELADQGISVFVHASHSVQFGQSIADLIPDSVLVNGSTARLERVEIYKQISNKTKMILVSDIGGVGLDIPSLGAIILASDLKDVRQLIGRVVRRAPGKDYGLVIDVKIPTTFIGKHRDTRLLQYTQEGATVV